MACYKFFNLTVIFCETIKLIVEAAHAIKANKMVINGEPDGNPIMIANSIKHINDKVTILKYLSGLLMLK